MGRKYLNVICPKCGKDTLYDPGLDDRQYIAVCENCKNHFTYDEIYGKFEAETPAEKKKCTCGGCKSGLEWKKPSAFGYKYVALYLAYQPGYPLMVVDWRTGEGYRDIRTRERVNPVLLAEINLPEKTGGE